MTSEGLTKSDNLIRTVTKTFNEKGIFLYVVRILLRQPSYMSYKIDIARIKHGNVSKTINNIHLSLYNTITE